MRIRIVCFSIFLLTSLIVFSPVLSDLSVFATSISLYRLTSGSYREDWPIIYKDKVLWLAEGQLNGYDFQENKEFSLFEGNPPLADLYAPVSYDGRYLVYNRYDGTSYNVSLYDTNVQEDINITEGLGSRWATDFDNGIIVYVDGGATGDLYTYNVNRDERNFIAHNVSAPKISGRYVVWYKSTSFGYDIEVYDLVRGEYVIIPNNENANRASPDINGEEIIYTYSKNGIYSVRLFDINKHEERILIESSTYTMSWPSISKKYAVWGKNTAQHVSGVEGVDLQTGEVFEIQEQGQHQNDNMSPIVNDNIAAWMAWRTGNGDIYAAVLNH